MSQKTHGALAALSLPKGGGATQGIGETFKADLFSGTGKHSIPIAVSPGRNDFGPKPVLEYSSGHGNGVFGLGWQLALPRITRKTEKGLPRYDDTDVFVMAGAEDLVRCLRRVEDPATRAATWLPEEPLTRGEFTIFRYRPRTEGGFARIERWVNSLSGATHWRSITKDNVTSVFGISAAARVTDPSNEQRVYEWLLEETWDAFGNRCLYEYAADDPALYVSGEAGQLPEVFERQRRATQRYLRRICYGNLPEPLLDPEQRPITYPDGAPVGVLRNARRYAFEVVFDYGDWSTPSVLPHPMSSPPQELFGADPGTVVSGRVAPLRPDRFSHFRAGFEIRTLRRCRRVLMFHHFAELGAPLLVRSTDFSYDVDPDTQLSLLRTVTVSGHGKDSTGSYRSSSMPAVTFAYAEFKPQEQRYQSLTALGGELPPLSLSDPNMALVDLFGDGLPDVLHTGPAGFRYWRNLGNGVLDRPRLLDHVPAGISLDQAGVGFGDMTGNGIADLLVNRGPLAGFFETNRDGAWQRFTPYPTVPSFAPQDPSVRLVDLTGDGRSDALLSADRHFLWFACQGERGFAAPQSIARVHDLDKFPDVFFDDPSGRVRLADMTGDGLHDIVRVGDGRIDYWPNLGYGRFGKRITMADAPRFGPDFDPKRLLLADLNGTGCADLVYVDTQRVSFWFNRSGNSWSERRVILGTPRTTGSSAFEFADVFGTGTATLLWSSDLGVAGEGNYKALDFCGGVKPYVLISMDNNMGATTRLSYAPSTRYFLEDRAQGMPWLGTLPFPVQVVDKVEVLDHISRTKLVTTYRYHHGHYDGREREFCGFGRVDRFDSQSFEDFSRPGLHGTTAAFSNRARAYHVPPVETRSWFHSGIYFDADREQTSDARDFTAELRREYYAQDTAAIPLEEHDVAPDATPHEAYRALRGAPLRTEVYALDDSSQAANPYQVEEHRYRIARLQPAHDTHRAVYFSHALESLVYHYERDPSDPRISHELTLELDAFGNALQTLNVAYGRRRSDPALPLSTDRDQQLRTFLTYTQNSYTQPVDDPDAYRTPLLCEARSYELSGFVPLTPQLNRFSHAEWVVNDFARIANAPTLGYEAQANGTSPQKRLIEHRRTCYRRNDLAGSLPLGALESLALPGETRRLVLTAGLLQQVYGERVEASMLEQSGYVRGEDQQSWWTLSGNEFYSPNPSDTPASELAFARQHFFAPHRVRDAFGNTTTTRSDPYVLLSSETRDALGNVTQAQQDYRVLQPFRITDPNGNRSEVAFDTLGLVVATAVMAKAGEVQGDSLAGLAADLTEAQRAAFLADPLGNAAAVLGAASTRIIYDFERYRREQQPVCTATVTRETHAGEPLPAGELKAQLSLSYFDGFSREVQKKVPAEPGPLSDGGPVVSRRWIGSGWSVFNNKGKPVKQFEPFFDDSHLFRFEQRAGVSSVVIYDPLERVVATLHPDHSWEKVAFNPWHQATWDVNDTVAIADPRQDLDVGGYFQRLEPSDYLPTWYEQRSSGALGAAEQAAALKAAVHAGTPTLLHADALGRTFLSVVSNRFERNGAVLAETHASRAVHDIEGNERAVSDARGRTVVRRDFDMLGTCIRHASMEAGEHWMLNDVGGLPAFAWDSRAHRLRHSYDALRRPVEVFLRDGSTVERLISRSVFGERVVNAAAANLRGRLFQQFDQAGVLTSEAYDFKGNLLVGRRQLAKDYKALLDWSAAPPLEGTVHVSRTSYDALNRPVVVVTPDGSVSRPQFNAAGLLERMAVQLRGASVATPFVTQIEYNAKGQRSSITYANGLRTTYTYDPLTLRLVRCQTLRGAEPLQDLAYVFDPAGNITHMQDEAQQTLYFKNQVVSSSADYTYDAVYRLLLAQGREHIGLVSQPQTSWNDVGRTRLAHPGDGIAMRRYSQQYWYDATGNLLQLSHQAANGNWTRSYSYQQASLLEPSSHSNRLSSVTVGTAAAESFPHDAHGNITAMPHLASLQWNYLDQLQRVELGGGATAYYVYDAQGQRIRKVIEKNAGAVIEERLTLAGFEIFRRSNGGTLALQRESLHVMDDHRRIALVDTRTAGTEADLPAQSIRYQLGNHIGSAALELDGSGQIISYEEYYPYGSTSYQAGRTTAEVSRKLYRYTGMERDEETGLNHHGVRYYAPWLCRWISADPIGIQGGINLYEYAKDRPTGLVDPAGTNPKRQLWLAEQKNFEIKPVATRTGRGITKSQHKALRGIQDAFGPKEQMHWGHPSNQTHGTTPAGASPPLRPQPGSENMHMGAGADKVAKQNARRQGLFTRDAQGVDRTVKPSTRFTQPPARPFEPVMGEYESSIARRTPPVQTPRAPATAPPSSAPAHEQLKLPLDKPPPPPPVAKGAPPKAVARTPSVVGRVSAGAGVAGLVGTVVKDLHEGHLGQAGLTAGIGAGSTYALTKVPALVPLAVMVSTINAYDDDVKRHANSAGSWVENKTGSRVVGAVAASAAATGESVFQGTFGAVGRGIGEGAAATYIRATSDEYTLVPWRSQLWTDIFD